MGKKNEIPCQKTLERNKPEQAYAALMSPATLENNNLGQ